MNHVDLGFAIFGTMLRRGRKTDATVFSTLVKGLCIKKRVREAAELIDRMPQWGCSPNLVTCNTLIDGLCGSPLID